MRFILTTVDRAGTVTDHLLDASGDATVAELARELRGPGAPAGPPPTLVVAGAPLDPALSLHEAPLRQGTVVGLDRPVAAVGAEPRGLVEVRIAGGRDAGTVVRLDIGEHLAGTAGTCRVRLDNPGGPAVAAALRVRPDGQVELAPAPGVAVTLDGTVLDGPCPWPEGAMVTIESGRRADGPVLELARPRAPDAALAPSEDGAGLDYNRPPRLLPAPRDTRYRLPSRPPAPERRPLSVLSALAPLAVSGTSFLVTRNPLTLLVALLSPLLLVANQLAARRQGRQSHRRRLADHEDHRARVEAEAAAALAAECARRRATYPDPAAVALIAVGPRRRLWERRRTDPDYLALRPGRADQPSDVVVTDPGLDEHRRDVRRRAPEVPVVVPLREHGVVGVAGGAGARAVAGWLVAQAAVLHSPEDLQLYVLAGARPGAGGAPPPWSWTRWLPHTAPRDGQDAVCTIGVDAATLARRVAELLALIAARRGDGARPAAPPRDVLVVLDGARRLRALPGITQLLRDGPAAGVFALCLDDEERLLPEECQAVVAEQADGSLLVSRTRAEPVAGVRPDLVTRAWCRTVARALAPVRDTGGAGDGAGLPDTSRLLDVLGLEPPTPDAVAARWATGGRTTEVVLGESLDGPFSLDLSRDGPHGLVAGTTGSGKSELLQTLVASLAVANRPDAMTFVLVDYKGGSAFKDCVDLPHTVGLVTDLDTHLVERALRSLSAELRRREHQLAAAGAKDIDDYVLLLGRDPGLPPLPRLVIVIDEFASMARELPDFVTGLVNIAQRGRSLGIHLVLATQRPGGVVSPEIRANTNLRISLRVTDTAESQDVVGAPDAASIARSTPGRAYVRLAQSSLVPFQAGRVGGFRPGARRDGARPGPWLAPLTWTDLARPAPARPAGAATDDGEVTDLAVLVGVVRDAAGRLGVAPQHRPWLPGLPAALVAGDLPAPAPGAYDLAPAPYGLVDLPDEQRQEPLTVDLARLGHLHVIGSARSGRSQALRSIAGALARTHAPDDVHLYGIDCGNGALAALAGLAHCGAVVQRNEGERLGRLLARLTAELGRRQQLLAASGSASLVEYRSARPPDRRPPHLVVLLDRWEVFDRTYADRDGGALMTAVLALMGEGASAGIHLVIAGDRALLSTRVSATTEDKLVLRLNERADYSVIGINHRNLPDEIPPGRALRADGAEVQIALLDPDPSGEAQARALAALAAAGTPGPDGSPPARRPFRVDVLPDELTLDDARTLGDRAGPCWALVGAGGDELTGVGPDLSVTPTFVVAGPARSGRSTVLLAMVSSLLDAGTPVVLAAPRRSPLRELAGTPGVLAVATGADLGEDWLRGALAGAAGPAVVVIDDAELLLKCDAGSELGEIARSGAEHGRALILAGTVDGLAGGFGGWHVDARRNGQGALLSPQSLGDAELLGAKLARSHLGAASPGRAVVHLGDGVVRTVQVPRGGTIGPAAGSPRLAPGTGGAGGGDPSPAAGAGAAGVPAGAGR